MARTRLEVLGSVVAYEGGDLGEFLSDKEVLFVRLARHIGEGLLRQAPRLRMLCSPTTGHTHLDLNALTKSGVRLLSLKGETTFLDNIRATPEHAVGLMLALLRNYRIAFLNEGNPNWDRDRCRGEELFGNSVGLIGFGRVGKRIASYLRSFEAQVGWYDPFVTAHVDFATRYDTLDALIAGSRIVVVAASVESENPILDRAYIAGLQGKYLVNIARGELVDEAALLEMVEAGLLAGCAVDVIRNENGSNNLARWLAAADRWNVLVTPHIGGATFASMRATEEFLVSKLIESVEAAGKQRAVP